MEGIKNMSRERLWTRQFAFILLINFFASVIMNMLNSTMSLYVDHIGGNKASVGLITGIFSLSALFFRPWFGNLIDNKSRKLVLLIGVGILSLVSLSYTLVYSVIFLLVLRIIHGIGLSAQSTAIGTVISDIAPRSRLSEGVGFSGIAATIATAVGPSLGLYLIQNYNYNVFFGVASAFGILAVIFSFYINYEKKENNFKVIKAKENITYDKRKKVAIFERTAVPASIVVFFMLFTVSSIFTFLPAYAIEKGIDNVGSFFTVYALSFLVGRTITDKLTVKYGINKIMIPGLILVIISYIMLAFASSLPIILFIGFIYGFGYSATQPTLNSIAVSKCVPERRGAANATFFSAMDSGFFIGATIWGIMCEKGGFTLVYLGSAICITLALISYMILLNRNSENEDKSTEYDIVENV